MTLTHGDTLVQRFAMFVHGDPDKTGLTMTPQLTVMVTQLTDRLTRLCQSEISATGTESRLHVTEIG